MIVDLKYGAANHLALEVPANRMVAHCAGPRGTALADPAAAAHRAVCEPLEMLPLSQVVTPGDRITLPMDEPTAGTTAALGGIIGVLMEGGVRPEDITCLHLRPDSAEFQATVRGWLPTEIRHQVQWQAHRPGDRGQLSYLAATDSGERIYLNRHLVDADVVLPIGRLRSRPDPGRETIFGTIYPQFSDLATQQRFRAGMNASAEEVGLLRDEVAHVGWLLGVLFAVALVPGEGDELRTVVAGAPAAADREARRQAAAVWRYEVPQRADVVICSVCGAEAQDWDDIGRALAAGLEVMRDDGALVVLSDLADALGPALSSLVAAPDPRRALAGVAASGPRDLQPAVRLAEALSRGRVYFLSRLDDAVAEDLGIVPLRDGSEVARLVQRHESCIILGSAQELVAVEAGASVR